MDRHIRQIRLSEVGEAGQARIAQAVVDVHLDGPAADVAVRYLAGAGVSRVRVRDATLARDACALAPALRVDVDPKLTVDTDPGAFDLRDAACVDLARGAHAALRALRIAIEGFR